MTPSCPFRFASASTRRRVPRVKRSARSTSRPTGWISRPGHATRSRSPCPTRFSAAPIAQDSVPSAAGISAPSRTSTPKRPSTLAGRSSISCARNDERRRRRDRDEAVPLEDRPARGQRVDVQPAVAALACELGTLCHRCAVEPTASVLRQRHAAEQAGEDRLAAEVDPAAGHRFALHERHDRDRLRLELAAFSEYTRRELDECIPVEPEIDVSGRRWNRSGLRDYHRLLVLRLEARLTQSLGQFGAVVRVVLPFPVAGPLSQLVDERLDVAVLRGTKDHGVAIAGDDSWRPHLLVEEREDLGR